MSITNISNFANEYEGFKKCAKCGEAKGYGGPNTNFDRDRTHSDGYRSQCRPCRRANEAMRRTKNREEKARLTVQEVERRRELDEKAQAHRDAILRLINAHRAEFESYVNAATIRMGKPAKPQPIASWVSAG